MPCGTSVSYTHLDVYKRQWQDQIAEWKAIDPEIDASNCKWFYEGTTIEELSLIHI